MVTVFHTSDFVGKYPFQKLAIGFIRLYKIITLVIIELIMLIANCMNEYIFYENKLLYPRKHF